MNFVDSHVYASAIKRWMAGGGPYLLVRTADKATNGSAEALAILAFWGWSAYRLLTITVSAQPVDAGSSNEAVRRLQRILRPSYQM
jgi:hypothetical protein